MVKSQIEQQKSHPTLELVITCLLVEGQSFDLPIFPMFSTSRRLVQLKFCRWPVWPLKKPVLCFASEAPGSLRVFSFVGLGISPTPIKVWADQLGASRPSLPMVSSLAPCMILYIYIYTYYIYVYIYISTSIKENLAPK